MEWLMDRCLMIDDGDGMDRWLTVSICGYWLTLSICDIQGWWISQATYRTTSSVDY